ncbi:hypothetical protein BJF93_10090 [Xaviernesmea oryzae]|uniref:O-antigen ligase-related domain-containing protein n=1 Tax=Xaviernesmea oryzae TaxID=464029 RepID=A0A1Q9AWW6_9HYPH|nr:O-antigen ligase family protein [Xaviernesmea oryzae]OLP59937.1 hypothetical protein BJF93_10090 [Xaviernesmea oryzae]SEK44151.1 O-antigen ligase [Xaviernesmea oryzae]
MTLSADQDLAPSLRISAERVASATLGFGVFLSGFVLVEPAPYELMMAALIALWAPLGLRISRTTAPLAALLLIFMIGGLMSLTVVKELDIGPMYMAVSGFLALTSIFFASVIEARAERLNVIFKAWTAAAVITAILGILGYFHLLPGGEIFTLYDRAKGAFQDPNVFGPFLLVPSLYLIHAVLKGRLIDLPLRAAGILILALGVFLSFSRAAWGLYVFAVPTLVLVMLIKERSGLFRVRMLTMALCGAMAMLIAIGLALQLPQVANLFSNRSQLVQEYDGGHLGRFERHRIGFRMMLERPLGIGPLEFSKIFPEDEHNIWLKCLTTYGWLGFAAYVTLMISTVAIGFRLLLYNRPWQPYLMIAWIALMGHAGIGNVIDIDHWRHAYLLFGILWGCAGLEARWRRRTI